MIFELSETHFKGKVKMQSISVNKVGEEVPPLTLTDRHGGVVRLDAFRGSWLLLVFRRHLA